MTADEAVRFVEERDRLGMRFGLDRMRLLLGRLGDPQRGRPAIHVVGTNGKSSTTRFAAAVMGAAGRRVGAYVSPHVVDWRERIQIDGVAISEEAFAEAVGEVAAAAEGMDDDPVTQFEVLTAAAFTAFARADVECMVVEAGLGGRYDASNVLDDAVVVLTNVSREHTDLLGDTEREIAAEKLAVVPDGGERLVIGPLTPAAQDAVRAIVRERGLSAWWAGTDVLLTAQGDEAEVATPRARYRLDAAGRPAYQLWNMALAVAAGERRLGAPPPQDAVRTAVAAVDTPGRFEVIPGEPTVILDGAHNPAAMEALAADLPEARPLVAVLSVLRDKDLDAMLAPLAGRVDRIVATASTNARVLPADELHRAVARKGMTVETVEHPVDAVARARQLAGPSGVVIVCGSLYLLTDVRGQAIHRTGSPPGKLARETPGNGRN